MAPRKKKAQKASTSKEAALTASRITSGDTAVASGDTAVTSGDTAAAASTLPPAAAAIAAAITSGKTTAPSRTSAGAAASTTSDVTTYMAYKTCSDGILGLVKYNLFFMDKLPLPLDWTKEDLMLTVPLGCINGKILLAKGPFGTKIVLWDPALNISTVIPKCSAISKNTYWFSGGLSEWDGDLKVILIYTFKEEGALTKSAHVFSLSKGKWSKIHLGFSIRFKNYWPFTVKQSPYWLVNVKNKGSGSEISRLITFSHHENTFKIEEDLNLQDQDVFVGEVYGSVGAVTSPKDGRQVEIRRKDPSAGCWDLLWMITRNDLYSSVCGPRLKGVVGLWGSSGIIFQMADRSETGEIVDTGEVELEFWNFEHMFCKGKIKVGDAIMGSCTVLGCS